jgi:hypothetical protein
MYIPRNGLGDNTDGLFSSGLFNSGLFVHPLDVSTWGWQEIFFAAGGITLFAVLFAKNKSEKRAVRRFTYIKSAGSSLRRAVTGWAVLR